jgi:hypothetical protein
MTALAHGLGAALEDGDLAAFGACLLQRARLEVGLAQIAGRPSILAWLNSLAAAFDAPKLHMVRQLDGPGLVAVDCRIEGNAISAPGIGTLLNPLVQASLNLRLWARLEGRLVVELWAIADWSEILRPAGHDLSEAARTLGAASPCHRPLGELGSGLGQLGTDPADSGWVADFNARRPMESEMLRQQVRQLLALMPDARLLPEASLSTGDGAIHLLRLMGHVNGRRVSLAASKVGGGEWDLGGSEPLRFDSLALSATAHRPFHPA